MLDKTPIAAVYFLWVSFTLFQQSSFIGNSVPREQALGFFLCFHKFAWGIVNTKITNLIFHASLQLQSSLLSSLVEGFGPVASQRRHRRPICTTLTQGSDYALQTRQTSIKAAALSRKHYEVLASSYIQYANSSKATTSDDQYLFYNIVCTLELHSESCVVKPAALLSAYSAFQCRKTLWAKEGKSTERLAEWKVCLESCVTLQQLGTPASHEGWGDLWL